jgi:hypothetical protein
MRRVYLVALAWFVAPPGWPADEPLGRLFFSPAQRAQLEEARRRNIRAEELASQAASKPKPPRARHVTVNGLIMRSDGASMIWVNGKPVESQTVEGLRVSPTASRESVVLRDAEKGRALRLKVGQRANLLTGAVEENYEARRAQAHAEEAAREAGSESAAAGKSSQRRPRKRALPDDEPQAPAASELAPKPAEGTAPAVDGTAAVTEGTAAAPRGDAYTPEAPARMESGSEQPMGASQ